MQRHQLNPTTAMFTFQRYLQTSADKAGLTIIFDKDTKVPYTTGKEVHIPRLSDKATEQDMVNLLHYVNHEAAHHKYGTDFNMIKTEGIDTKHPLGMLFNMIEDTRVDKHDSDEWLGDAVNLSDYYDMISPTIIKEMKKLSDDSSIEAKPKAAMQTMVALDYLARDNVMGAALNAEEVLKAVTPEAHEFIKRAMEEGFIEEIKDLKEGKEGSAEAWDIAQRIYETVFELDPEEAKEEMKENASGDGESSSGKEESASEGASEGEYGKGKEPTWDLNPITVKYKQLGPQDLSESYGGTGIHLDYTDYDKYDSFSPSGFDDMAVVDYERGTFKNINEKNDNDRVNLNLETMSGKGLANKVRRLLQIRSKAQLEYGKKKGKIHARNLHRVTMRDAPGYNERVFKKRIENNTLDTAVSLLVDFSGSMHGNKITHAIQSSILLYQAISKSLNVPLEIIGFSDRGDKSVMLVFKSFDGKLSDEKLLSRMTNGTSYMSSNADGEAIAWTYDRLQGRREKKKLLVVLSDGSPACARQGDIYDYTKKVIEGIEDGRTADIVGIGIMDDNVKRLYKTHQVIKRTEELEGAILNLVEKRIINE